MLTRIAAQDASRHGITELTDLVATDAGGACRYPHTRDKQAGDGFTALPSPVVQGVYVTQLMRQDAGDLGLVFRQSQ